MSEVIGKIIVLNDTETVGSAGTFRKRLVVIETDEQYKQSIPIDFVQDKTGLLDAYNIGDNVVVCINIRGNSYNGKYYVSLNGWKINKQDTSKQTPIPSKEAFVPATNLNEEEANDLPF